MSSCIPFPLSGFSQHLLNQPGITPYLLMRTNVINLLNRVPEHDRKDFIHATQNEM